MLAEPYELNPANYPAPVTVQTRFGDIASSLLTPGGAGNSAENRHQPLKSVRIAQLFEEGRMRVVMRARAQNPTQLRRKARFVTVSVLNNFIGPVRYPDPVDIYCGISHFGASSYTLSCLMLQAGQVVAHGRSVAVHSVDGKAITIPDDVRAEYNALFLRRDV